MLLLQNPAAVVEEVVLSESSEDFKQWSGGCWADPPITAREQPEQICSGAMTCCLLHPGSPHKTGNTGKGLLEKDW